MNSGDTILKCIKGEGVGALILTNEQMMPQIELKIKRALVLFPRAEKVGYIPCKVCKP